MISEYIFFERLSVIIQTDSDDVTLFSRHDSAECHWIVAVYEVCFKDNFLKLFKFKLM